MHSYPFSFEIEGPMGMFMRPDSGSTPVSYPIPTGSAIIGMVESIALVRGAIFRPHSIEICSPIVYASYACNYGGPLRKPAQVIQNTNFQHYARVIAHPHFKIHGECVQTSELVEGNACHKLQAMLERRLEAGQSRFPACLGWKEFAPTYFGKLRDTTVRDASVSEVVEGYLVSVWGGPNVWAPRFRRVKIVEGECLLAGVYDNVA